MSMMNPQTSAFKPLRAVFSGVLITLSLLISFANPLHAQTDDIVSTLVPEKVILQLKWYHEFNFAGYYAAVEQGYYRAAGLDVTIKEGLPGMDFIAEVVSGNANYGVEMPELLIAFYQGKPVVVLAPIFQHSPQILLSRADTGIKSPHNLSGKKVMWRFDSAAELRAMLASEKVSLKQIQFVELSWDINDLIEGRADAMHAYITDQPLLLQKAGVEYTTLNPINYGIDFYGDCLFTSKQELSDHPDRVAAFREASIRGWSYAMAHPEEIMRLIKQKYNPDASMEFMQHEYEHIHELMLPELVEIGHQNPGRWKAIADTFVDLDMIGPDYSLDGFLYDPVGEADFKNVMRIIWVLLIVLVIVLLITIGLIFFNRKLNHQVLKRTAHLSKEIAERKEIEMALRVSQQFNESLLNTSPDVIYIYDIIEQKNVYSNEGVGQILGYTPSEISDMGSSIIAKLMHPEDFAHYVDQIIPRYGTAADGELIENEYRMKHKDGEWRWIHAKELIYIRLEDGTPKQIFGINSDITTARKAEQDKLDFEKKILQTQKLESLGVLAGGIAHDFNNILMGILGYADLALSNIEHTSQAYEYVGGIKASSRKAADLVKQILAYSGKGKFSLESIDINHLIEDTVQMLKISISKKVDIQMQFSDQPVFMQGDPSQIRQIIMNLVLNASDAIGDKNGSITLKTGFMYCDRQYIEDTGFESQVTRQDPLPEGQYLFLEVSDTGIGMVKDTLSRIFDPFFTTKFPGRGLGLSAVLGIVNGHQGTLKIYSELNKGTSFKLLFPLDENPKHVYVGHASVDTHESPWQGEGLVLIADDESAVRIVCKRIVEKMGFEVLTASDGLEAVQVFREHQDEIVCVLLDLTMPGKDGTEVFREIKQLDPGVKVILSSGYNEQDATQHFVGKGLAGFIQKPYVAAELMLKIKEILQTG